jgi:aminopeptidase N
MTRYLAQTSLLIFIFGGTSAFADPYVRQPSVDAIHYDISIEVTDTSDSIAGTTKIQVLIRGESAAGMWLDFEDMSIEKLLVGGNERPYTYGNGRLAFAYDRTYLRNETVGIEVRYHGKPREGVLFGRNRYGRRAVFADNWPDNAHHWFPSIDHPSDKASVSFTVTAPQKYTVVANGKRGKTLSLSKGRSVAQWSEGKSIPTYCMAFGIAEFSVLNSVEGAIPLVWYVYPQDSEFAAAKFRRTAQMLAFFEGRIGPYPYEKLAQVESIVKFGAMENSNAIFYSDSLFLGKPASDEPVAHEIAHQWFGNSVTESDWDHLWLSEGFATYFEALFFEYADGPEALKQVMARYADRITAYKPALYEPVVNPDQTDPLKKLTPINYEKGAWILHMLRGMLGDEMFFNGIRRFYSMYEGRNASSEDFQKVLEGVSATDLSTYFKQWLHRPGLPEYRLTWHWSESTGELAISVLQVQTTGLFDMPVEIVVSAGTQKDVYRFRIREAAHSLRIPLRTKPLTVELDPNNWILKSRSTAAQ